MTEHEERISIPTSNGWPMVLAFGVTLLSAGLVTHWLVSALGLACIASSLIGWFREVLPAELHQSTPAEPEADAVKPGARVMRLEVGELAHRARLPLERYPYSAGVVGGLFGGVAMAIVAILYGVIWHGSVWYPINLLAASGSADISAMSYAQLRAVSVSGLILATIIHVLGSALIGLLYGIALPMFPRHPIILGGLLAPLFWSGILHSALGIINPALADRIDWKWFMASQFAFGLVAGFVVARYSPIKTLQFVPFLARAGIEAPGLMHEKSDEEAP